MRLAAIDLGSNSFRLEIGRVEGMNISTETYLKEGVRLAAGLNDNGYLTEAAQHKALETLKLFHTYLVCIPQQQIRIVGTQTLRTAKNADAFLKKAEDILNHPIEILSGQEEARLVFKGCAHSLPIYDGKRLIVDVGGASTELAIGKHYEASYCESFHIGCVNTTIDHFKDGKINENNFNCAYLAAKAEFSEARFQYQKNNWDRAFGSSGSMEALCSLCNHTPANYESFITRNHLLALKAKLIDAGTIQALDIPELPESRKGVIAGGLAVLLAVFDTLGIEHLFFAPGALRRGVMYALLERLNGQDLRQESIKLLLKRTRTDYKRADYLAKRAITLYEALEEKTQAEHSNRLYWACLSCNIGKAISPNGHHHHGAYLLAHSHLPGFSKTEQDWMSRLVLGHRGKLNKVEQWLSNPSWTNSLLILRVVHLFAHEDNPKALENIAIKQMANRHWVITIKGSEWLNQHPLTFFLLKHEVEAWKALKYRLELDIQ